MNKKIKKITISDTNHKPLTEDEINGILNAGSLFAPASQVNYVGSLYMPNPCNHIIDVKMVSGDYVSYCTKCGAIFETKPGRFR